MNGLVVGMNEAGKLYEEEEYYIPELLICSDAMYNGLDVLRPLLKQKRKSIKAGNDYELNQKLVRFALSRGFTFDIIRQCLNVDEIDEYEEDF